MKKRIAVFIDNENILCSIRKCFGEVRFDHGAILRFAAQRGDVTIANLYTGRDYNNPNQAKLLAILKAKGFRVVTRPVKTLPDGTYKANTDVLLAIDAVRLMKDYDEAILVTGDSDFEPLVEYLTHQGKTVTIIGPNGATSIDLILGCHHFLSVDQVDGFIIRREWQDHHRTELTRVES